MLSSPISMHNRGSDFSRSTTHTLRKNSRPCWEKNLMEYIAKILVLVATFQRSEAGCSSAYGARPCNFVPAPPGRAPSCASRPGVTFCEFVPKYPMQHIKFLVDKWGYDFATLFSSETKDEYGSFFSHMGYGYGTTGQPHHYYPESIPPAGPGFAPGGHSTYVPPPTDPRVNFTDGFAGYPDRRPSPNAIFPQGYHQQQQIKPGYQQDHFKSYIPPGYYDQRQEVPPVSFYEPSMWLRYGRSHKNYQPHFRKKRSKTNVEKRAKNRTLEVPAKNETSEHTRSKRQSRSQTLCETRSEYIMPKAAVNKEGNWMYVVNLQEVDNRLTQLVKSEMCASEQCSGLCSLPLGYQSRCEQKYVQKRLVALDSGGQRLYTDVFWFPSCCICTITR